MTRQDKPMISGKAIITLAAIVLALTVTTLIYQREKPFLPQELKASLLFSDISKEEEKNIVFNAALSYLQKKGIMKGYDDGTFKPDNPINRAEFAKILTTAFIPGEVKDEKVTCFNDIKVEDWYAKYFCLLKNKGWINGYGDGTVKPANNINQVEALKMLLIAVNWTSEEAAEPEWLTAEEKKQWYASYISIAAEKNILSRSELDPDKLLTRKEVAILLFKSILVDTLKIANYQESKMNDLFKVAGIPFTGPAPVTSEPKPKPKK